MKRMANPAEGVFKPANVALLATGLVVVTALSATAANAQRQETEAQLAAVGPRFEYAVKFVCGGQQPADAADIGPVVPGLYATAINVHNPSFRQHAKFVKKVAVAFPREEEGPISRFREASLSPDGAFEIDCPDIRGFDFPPNDDGTTVAQHPFLKGFVVIISPVELDVWAVYTAIPSPAAGAIGSGITMHHEVVQPRRISRSGVTREFEDD